MQMWGLTGGIASGKSTVAAMFAARDIATIDADAVYHGLLTPHDGQPSALAQQVAAAYPHLTLLRADGSLDRGVLGQHIFADRAARLQLETLTHPAVGAQVARELAALAARGVAHALYDVPLLFEKELQSRFAGVVLAWVPRATQVARLMARDGVTAAAAAARLAAQMPLDAKRARATWVIDNSGTLVQTEEQVAEVCAAMQKEES